MACKTESKQIGDHEYSVTQWPASKSILIKLKLTKCIGPALAKIAGAMTSSKKSKKAKEVDQIEGLSDGLSSLFILSSPEEITSLLQEVIVGAACDGKRITISSFDELFSGDELMDMYKVFFFVLQVNYSNLFKGQLAQDLLAKAQIKL